VRPELERLRDRLRLPIWHRADIEAEITSHLEDAEAQLRAQSQDADEARKAALECLGDLGALGQSLYAIHHGWTGGATVRIRFARLVLFAVALCAAMGLWFYVVMSAIRPGLIVASQAQDDRLWTAAYQHPDPMDYAYTLLRYREANPLAAWMGIVDPSGKLLFSDPTLGWQGKPLPEADWFLIRFGASGKRAASPGASSDPLKGKLKTVGIPAVSFESVDLGRLTPRGLTKQTYSGTAIIAYAPPLWGEQVIRAATTVWLWFGIVWLLSAAAILLYHHRADAFGAWIWAAFALVFGPGAWLVYLVLGALRQLPQVEPEGRAGRLRLMPLAGLAFTALLLARPLLVVPAAAVDLYAFQPQRAAETLRQSRWGVRILLRAAESRQYLTRRAGAQALQTYLSDTTPQQPALFSKWMRLLKSPYPDVRELGSTAILGITSGCPAAISADKVFQAWKVLLSHPDTDIRNAAWIQFTLALTQPKGFPYQFANRIPELLALGEREPDLRGAFATWLPYGRQVYGPVRVPLGSERRFAMTFSPSQQYAHPEYFAEATRAVATSPNVEASIRSSPGPKGPSVELEFWYHARGPVGMHWVRINFFTKQGRVVGVVDIKAEEIARR